MESTAATTTTSCSYVECIFLVRAAFPNPTVDSLTPPSASSCAPLHVCSGIDGCLSSRISEAIKVGGGVDDNRLFRLRLVSSSSSPADVSSFLSPTFWWPSSRLPTLSSFSFDNSWLWRFHPHPMRLMNATPTGMEGPRHSDGDESEMVKPVGPQPPRRVSLERGTAPFRLLLVQEYSRELLKAELMSSGSSATGRSGSEGFNPYLHFSEFATLSVDTWRNSSLGCIAQMQIQGGDKGASSSSSAAAAATTDFEALVAPCKNRRKANTTASNRLVPHWGFPWKDETHEEVLIRVLARQLARISPFSLGAAAPDLTREHGAAEALLDKEDREGPFAVLSAVAFTGRDLHRWNEASFDIAAITDVLLHLFLDRPLDHDKTAEEGEGEGLDARLRMSTDMLSLSRIIFSHILAALDVNKTTANRVVAANGNARMDSASERPFVAAAASTLCAPYPPLSSSLLRSGSQHTNTASGNGTSAFDVLPSACHVLWHARSLQEALVEAGHAGGSSDSATSASPKLSPRHAHQAALSRILLPMSDLQLALDAYFYASSAASKTLLLNEAQQTSSSLEPQRRSGKVAAAGSTSSHCEQLSLSVTGEGSPSMTATDKNATCASSIEVDVNRLGEEEEGEVLFSARKGDDDHLSKGTSAADIRPLPSVIALHPPPTSLHWRLEERTEKLLAAWYRPPLFSLPSKDGKMYAVGAGGRLLFPASLIHTVSRIEESASSSRSASGEGQDAGGAGSDFDAGCSQGGKGCDYSDVSRFHSYLIEASPLISAEGLGVRRPPLSSSSDSPPPLPDYTGGRMCSDGVRAWVEGPPGTAKRPLPLRALPPSHTSDLMERAKKPPLGVELAASETCATAPPFPSPRTTSSAHAYLYAKDAGLLNVPASTLDKLGVSLITLEVSTGGTCLGPPILRLFLEYFLGYNTVVLNAVMGAIGGGGFVAMEHSNVVFKLSHATEVQRFTSALGPSLLLKMGTLCSAIFLLFAASSLASFVFSQTQQRMLRFTIQLQQQVQHQRPLLPLIVSHLLDSLVVIPMLLGVVFFLFEFFSDQLLGFLVFVVVWCCELWSVASCRTYGSVLVFPRVYCLNMTWFLVYYLTFPFGFHLLALGSVVLGLFTGGFHLWSKYELPALLNGSISARQPRAEPFFAVIGLMGASRVAEFYSGQVPPRPLGGMGGAARSGDDDLLSSAASQIEAPIIGSTAEGGGGGGVGAGGGTQAAVSNGSPLGEAPSSNDNGVGNSSNPSLAANAHLPQNGWGEDATGSDSDADVRKEAAGGGAVNSSGNERNRSISAGTTATTLSFPTLPVTSYSSDEEIVRHTLGPLSTATATHSTQATGHAETSIESPSSCLPSLVTSRTASSPGRTKQDAFHLSSLDSPRNSTASSASSTTGQSTASGTQPPSSSPGRTAVVFTTGHLHAGAGRVLEL